MKHRLKIGIVVDQLLAGGVQLSAIDQVRGLNKKGHQATLVILMRKKYSTDFSYLTKDVPHFYLSDRFPFYLRRTIKFPLFSFLSTLHVVSPLIAHHFIKQGEFDVLVSHGTTTCLTTQTLYRKLGIPYIAVIHDPMVYILKKVYAKTLLRLLFPVLIPVAKTVERSFVKDSACTIIDSHMHFSYLHANYGITPIVLPLSRKVPPLIPHTSGRTILSIGRWQKAKNPELLLDVIDKIPNTKLILAGNWLHQQEFTWFTKQVREKGLYKKVQLLTDFDEESLHKVAGKSQVFAYPHEEAFGLSALEAASFGLPIVMPLKSGVSEHFKDGIHGFFPKDTSLTAYVTAIRTLLNNPILAAKMGASAYAQVKTHFSPENHINNLEAMLALVMPTDDYTLPLMSVLETCRVTGQSLSGGDKLMEPMAAHLYTHFRFEVVTSVFGAIHWKTSAFPKAVHTLPITFFDRRNTPLFIFLTYCLRMWFSYLKIRSSNSSYIYSSTNLLPDVFPAALTTMRNPNIFWIARVHHLIPPPQKREGRWYVNVVSFAMQIVSLYLMRNSADVVIALNTLVAQELIGQGIPAHKVHLLGAGVDAAKINSTKVTHKTPLFDGIFVGRIHPVKGIYDLVKIWKKVSSEIPSAKLAIVGEGEAYYKDELNKRIQAANMSQNIYLLGYAPDEELYALLKNSKVFLFTDYEAGWGLAIGEAMSTGLPVVGYDVGVLGEVFSNGFILVQKGRYYQFAGEVTQLLKDRGLRRKYSEFARVEMKNKTWKKVSQQFIEIISTARNNYYGK